MTENEQAEPLKIRPFLVSALVERPGVIGHRSRVVNAESEHTALGSTLALWQTDGWSVTSYEIIECDTVITKETMMTDHTEIPADVMEAAQKLAEDIIQRMCMTMDHSFGLQTTEQQRGLRLSMSQVAEHDVCPVIARAILAERERCARIAEGVGNFGDYKRDELTKDYGQPRFDMVHEIAAAIRK